jgi:hypothetical protein
MTRAFATPLTLAGAAAAVIAYIAACDRPSNAMPAPTEPRPAASMVHSVSASRDEDRQGPGPEVARQLAALKAATAKYQSFEHAKDDGYAVKLTECMSTPELGGMGFHYGKSALIDGTLAVTAPEVLLYEPKGRRGKLTLVGVEYIIPYTIHPRESEAPTLFGKSLRRNDVFQLWALHAWVWEENPSGVFADWNPRVSCPPTK